jgi:pyruvate kinase
VTIYTTPLSPSCRRFPNNTGKGASHEHLPLVISKIESVEALVNFDAILEVSDGIMVARGDLAVEIPMETLANVQKEIVRRCNAAGTTHLLSVTALHLHSNSQSPQKHSPGKPVIVATQMLETMQKNPRPTRAECTDVANAVFDGADCVMLSGGTMIASPPSISPLTLFLLDAESAKGKYPVETVTLMNRIVAQSELAQAGECLFHRYVPWHFRDP